MLSVKKSTKLNRIFGSIAQRLTVDSSSLRFLLNGIPLRGDMAVGDSGVQDGDAIDVVSLDSTDLDMDVEGVEEGHGLPSLSPELRKELARYRSTQRHAHLVDHYPLNYHAQVHMRRLLQAIDGCIAKENAAKNATTDDSSSSSTEAADQAPPEVAAAAAELPPGEPAVAAALAASVPTSAVTNSPKVWGMAKWFAARMQSA